MKPQGKNVGKLKRAYYLPPKICESLEKAAKDNDSNINEEVITILKEYFDGSLVKLDPMIKNAVELYAKKKGFTVTVAANFLISTDISVTDEVKGIIGTETDKADTQKKTQNTRTKEDAAEFQGTDESDQRRDGTTGE